MKKSWVTPSFEKKELPAEVAIAVAEEEAEIIKPEPKKKRAKKSEEITEE